MPIKNKNIVITGAASGIGKALVTLLVPSNQVLAIDRDLNGLSLLKEECPEVETLYLDLLDEGAVEESINQAQKMWGHIDLYFANAGFGKYGNWAEMTKEDFENIFKINTWIPFKTAQTLIKTNSSNFRLVIIASAIAYWAVPGYNLYSASKAAMHQLAESIRSEGKADWLTLVYPSATETEFFKNAGKNIPKAYPVQSAEKVASIIIKGVKRNKKYIYPSFIFRSVLLINRWIPFIKPIYQKLERRKFLTWSKRKFENS